MKFRMPKQEKTQVKTYKQTVVNAVILVVVLSLFLYVAIQLSRNFSTQVSTQRTQMITDVTRAYFDGYIFKDSSAVSADGDIVHYLVSDGEKVGVGQAYADVYSGTALSAEECRQTEQRLNDLSYRIKLLESGLEGGKNVSDLGNISDDISGSYYTYVDSILGGEFSSADKVGGVLLGSLVDYSAITLSEVAKNTLSSLKKERDELINSIGGRMTTLVSESSFIFNYDADGYENIFNSARLDALSASELDLLIAKPRDNFADSIGSAVNTAKWYLALPTNEVGYISFRDFEGSAYTVSLGSDELSVNMLLEKAVSDEDDPGKCYLLFSSFDMTRISGLSRMQDAAVTLDSCTGYRVPSGALQNVNRQTGVYILVGNMIEFRRVTIIGEGDGYYIVNTYENDLAEDLPTDIPYLHINDLIVTSGRDLYDGKLLD